MPTEMPYCWARAFEFDSEDGLMVYEVEFYAGGTEYDYDINARTGETTVRS